jgi:hypothetical protein
MSVASPIGRINHSRACGINLFQCSHAEMHALENKLTEENENFWICSYTSYSCVANSTNPLCTIPKGLRSKFLEQDVYVSLVSSSKNAYPVRHSECCLCCCHTCFWMKQCTSYSDLVVCCHVTDILNKWIVENFCHGLAELHRCRRLLQKVK